MSEIDYEVATEIFKALANETRLRILTGLLENECNVTGIVENLELPQSTVSQQLGLLRNRGIIKGRKEGANVCYRVIDERIPKILDLMKE